MNQMNDNHLSCLIASSPGVSQHWTRRTTAMAIKIHTRYVRIKLSDMCKDKLRFGFYYLHFIIVYFKVLHKNMGVGYFWNISRLLCECRCEDVHLKPGMYLKPYVRAGLTDIEKGCLRSICVTNTGLINKISYQYPQVI